MSSIEQPDRPTSSKPDRLGDVVGRIGKTVLEIAGDGKRRGTHDLLGMNKRFLPRHPAHIRPAEREGKAGGGGGERHRAGGRHHAGGADIPWVGDDKAARLVQVVEPLVAFGKAAHARTLSDFGSYIGASEASAFTRTPAISTS